MLSDSTKKPKVSIVIPVYNTASWLEECLNSVINQTMSDLEIVCVDDASTDTSPEILDDYSHRDARIRVITLEQNEGLSHARNVGMDTAGGEYIYFLDSDDFITSDAIDRLYAICKLNHLDIAYFDANFFSPDTATGKKIVVPAIRKRKEYDKVQPGSALCESFIKNDEWHPFVQIQFYSSDFLRNNRLLFFEGIIHEDELFSIICALTAKRVLHIPELLYNKRSREDSIIHSKKNAKNFVGLFCSAYYANRYLHERQLHCPYIKSQISKLYCRAIALFNNFREDIPTELEKLQDKEIMAAYSQFETLQDAYYAYAEMSNALIHRVQNFEHIFIYGAGAVAQSVYAYLIPKGIRPKGFIVTDGKDNPKMIHECVVQDFDCFVRSDRRKDSIVIIAMKHGKEEVKKMLDQLAIQNVFYNDDFEYCKE